MYTHMYVPSGTHFKELFLVQGLKVWPDDGTCVPLIREHRPLFLMVTPVPLGHQQQRKSKINSTFTNKSEIHTRKKKAQPLSKSYT